VFEESAILLSFNSLILFGGTSMGFPENQYPQHAGSHGQPIQQTVVVHQQPSNGIGVAGFICSLIGLVFCGVPGIIGLILSLIGLAKEPRGFAIAGVVISLANVAILVFMFMAGFTMLFACLGLASAINQFEIAQDWNLKDGTTVQGVYQTSDDQEVTIRKSDGSNVTINLDGLTAESRSKAEAFRKAKEDFAKLMDEAEKNTRENSGREPPPNR
jgi:hypothetical protein